MRKLFIAVFMFVSSFGSNVMADGHSIKMGIILGFTGPIESLTPAMAASAELAFKEASDSGSLLGCLLYTSPSPRDRTRSRMPSSA